MKTNGVVLSTVFSITAACGTADPTLDPHTPEGLQPPARGYRLHAGELTVEPGGEIEYCEIVQLPGSPSEVIWVQSMESAMAKGSHHLIVSAIHPGSEMEAELAVGARLECPFGARAFGEDFETIFGSQAPYRADSFPAGVGRRLHGGQKIIVDYHYYNATREPIEAKIAINIHSTDESEIEHIVSVDGFYNFTIRTPAREERSFVGECRVSEDLIVERLIRHTHRWGTNFSVWFAGGERDGELAFTSDHYEDTDHIFDAPVLVRGGDGFRFQCDFRNTESYELVFGNSAKDEMCILFFSYWSPEGRREPPLQDCYMRRVAGDGIARP